MSIETQQSTIGTAASVGSSSDGLGERQVRLSELRAKVAIKQQQVEQLKSAIKILADEYTPDGVALSLAEMILNANIGP